MLFNNLCIKTNSFHLFVKELFRKFGHNVAHHNKAHQSYDKEDDNDTIHIILISSFAGLFISILMSLIPG